MYGGFLDSGGDWIGGVDANLLATTPDDENWHEYSVDLVAPSGTVTVGWNTGGVASTAVDFMRISHGGSAAVPGYPSATPPAPSGSGQWGTSTAYVPADTVYPVPAASTIPVSDDADYYTGVDVETILQELGATVESLALTQVWEAVTDGEDVFVWEGDDLVHEWRAYP